MKTTYSAKIRHAISVVLRCTSAFLCKREMQNTGRFRRSFLLNQCQGRNRVPFITVTAFAVVIGVILLAFLVFGDNAKPKTTLKLVSIIFRHGDRTPTETYPTDPYKNTDVWTEGWGALTKTGKMQMYGLGEFLRSNYEGFLSDFYSPSEILIRSSDNDRCIMSADTLLAGLYPPKDHQVWNPDLLWQPIPVHATPRLQDKLIVMKKPCPMYQQELKAAYLSPEIQLLNLEKSAMYKYLSNHTGQAVEDILAVEFLFNTLEIEDYNNLDLPSWTKKYYPVEMKKLATKSLELFTQTTVMKRLSGGPLVAEIVKNMVDKDAGTLKPDRKAFLYSAHDVTIVNVLRTLGLSNIAKPEYGATILVELHTTKAAIGHEVKLLYMNSSTTTQSTQLNIPNCGQPCFLETFVKATEPNVPSDWEKECLI